MATIGHATHPPAPRIFASPYVRSNKYIYIYKARTDRVQLRAFVLFFRILFFLIQLIRSSIAHISRSRRRGRACPLLCLPSTSGCPFDWKGLLLSNAVKEWWQDMCRSAIQVRRALSWEVPKRACGGRVVETDCRWGKARRTRKETFVVRRRRAVDGRKEWYFKYIRTS